jgi:patatin-like phospholipase/acyl hydrolase
VLSLDGGGFRGLVTARLIERLEERVPGFLSSVDLVAGTSGGGILALLLAAGYAPGDCERLCRHAAEHVFRSSWTRALNPFTSR